MTSYSEHDLDGSTNFARLSKQSTTSTPPHSIGVGESNASDFITSSATSRAENTSNFFSHHAHAATLPSTYNQLIDYLRSFSVTIIDSTTIDMGKEIGSGATFFVQEAQVLNRALHVSKVAVKTPRKSIHRVEDLRSTLKEVLDEIKVMAYYRVHAHVATLYGVILEEKGGLFLPRLVMEHAVGSFGSLLRKRTLPWTLKLKFCMEAAAGLEALHNIQTVHSDVKADNILIFYSFFYQGSPAELPFLVAKVSDFGFCVPDVSSRGSPASRGTPRFKAPEALPDAPDELREFANQPQRDIYSFGVLVWEAIADGERPFIGLDDDETSRLQLLSQDAAACYLVNTRPSSTNGFPHTDAFLRVISGTVRRHPIDGGGRMSWQDIFDTLILAADDTCVAANTDWSFVDYFTQEEGRQYPVSGSLHQREPWLPIAPILSSVSTGTNDSYATLILQELDQLSRLDPPDWAATIRLAIHYHQLGETSNMHDVLDRFSRTEPTSTKGIGDALFHLALQLDAVEVVRALLSKRILDDINAFDICDFAPLYMVKSTAAANVLIENGADVNIQSDSNKMSPLHCAMSGPIAEVLLQAGANVNALDHHRRTPIHTAMSGDVVAILARHGANLLLTYSSGITPLHSAAKDDIALAIMKYAGPAAVHARDSMDRTPLHAQADNWAVETMRYALECGADPRLEDKGGNIPLDYCRSNLSTAKYLYNALQLANYTFKDRQWRNSSPLIEAITPEMLSLFLLQYPVKGIIDRRDNSLRGETALTVVSNRDDELRRASTRTKFAHASLIDRLRSNPDPQPISIGRLLEQSLPVYSVARMEILLEQGADPNIANNAGDTPLHIVAQNVIGGQGHDVNIAMLRLLLKAGANINARNKEGETPLHLARRLETVLDLLEANADACAKDKRGSTAMHNLIRLHGAFHEVVSALVRRGANIEARNHAGFTPLHIACQFPDKRFSDKWGGQSVAEAQQTRLPVIQALLDHGADVNALGHSMRTPLGLLSEHVYAPEEYRLLLSRGARLTTNAQASTFMGLVLQIAKREPKQPWWAASCS